MNASEKLLLAYGEGLLADKSDPARDGYLKDCLLDIQQEAARLYREKTEDVRPPEYIHVGRGGRLKLIEIF